MRDVGRIDDETCREFQGGVELVGKRWTAAILLALARGGERFAELHHGVDGISARLLAVRLKELQDNELVERTVVPSTPVQIRYTLTERGRDLLRSLIPLIRWQQRWGDAAEADKRSAVRR